MAGKQLQAVLRMFRSSILQQGWSLLEEREIQNGVQLLVTDGITSVIINCYTNGNAYIQGAAGALKTGLQNWWQQQQASHQQEKEVVAHIGTDEVGKGDYFGPLVVAGIHVDEHTAPQLLAVGVRDSKRLSNTRILSLAQEIKNICQGQEYILTYHPERYNQLYKQTPNLNHLLAEAHAQVIANLQKRFASTFALVDQFGDALLIPSILQKMGRQIILEQRIHAEDDGAVAAASIVARAEFVKQIAELSKMVGISLPKGASNPHIVTVGREIVARADQETLGKVAKLHFKTTQAILQQRGLFD